MSLDKILVIIFGILGISFTYWFFLMKKDGQVFEASGGEVDVLVEGGYKPDIISLPKGKTTKLNFLRKDESTCLEEIVMPDFKIRKALPLNEKVTVEITPKKSGEFPFSCGMNMFHGKVVVA